MLVNIKKNLDLNLINKDTVDFLKNIKEGRHLYPQYLHCNMIDPSDADIVQILSYVL